MTAIHTFRKMNGHPIWWTDPSGMTHLCEGTETAGARIFRSLCDLAIPPKALFGGVKGAVPCPACADRAR